MKKIFTFFLFIFLSAANTFAQYTKLLDFGKPANGKFPPGSLISDGTFLYGMTKNGGVNDMGVIFKTKPDGTEFTKLVDFDSVNGKNPYGDLFSDGIFLYGMTETGGTNNKGVIFKIMHDGTGYSKLLDFAGNANGTQPHSSLISDGIFLYGMTSGGGINGVGTIFKIMPDGTGYSKLLDFSSVINGAYPWGALIYDGTFLYGMTTSGGVNSMGVIFKIKPDGTGYYKLLDFSGITNGNHPNGSLISDGTFLYGMTSQGGISTSCGTFGCGVIFKIKPDGTSYSKLLDFAGTSNGSHPKGSLIYDSSFLYGMTSDGGINNSYGTLFKIKSDGTGYSKLLDFSGYPANGKLPYGSLISNGTFFYGMTYNGGKNDIGAIFKIKSDGTGYANLPCFTSHASGSRPWGDLISDGTFLYGTTGKGGIKDSGVVFKIKPNGTGYSKLLDFKNSTNGSYPYFGSLVSDGVFLYGTTCYGGTNNNGTIFKIKPDGTGYSKLLDFTGANGSNPYGSLLFNGTFLYGLTSAGGTYNSGIVFKILPDGSGFVDLYNFTWSASDGGAPEGSLISDGTFLYGMTHNGGSSGDGTIFKIKQDGTGYLKLHDFTDGALPTGSLIFDGTYLYGMAGQGGTGISYSGTWGCGIIFKIKPDGTGYLKLYDFIGSADGCQPWGSLISDGPFLFGMTKHGGTDDGANGMGVVFKIKSDGTGYSTLHNFGGNPIDGSYPDGSLVSDGTFLYGMTLEGGANSMGIIFKCQYCSPVTFTQSPILCGGQSLTIGSNTYSTSGTYVDIINSQINGCDSIVTTHLTVSTVDTAVTFTQSLTVCQGQGLIVGIHTYTASGTYHDTLISYHSCDSTVTTHLTVNTVDTSVVFSNATITSNATNATYQWIDCSNGNAPIVGQTNQSFTAIVNGNYAVIITKNGCSGNSSCHNITNLGIIENNLATTITISPNPFNSQTTIAFDKEQKNTRIKIIDVLGKEIKTIDFTGKQLIIEKGEMKAGTYFLQMQIEQETISKKLIINK